MAAPELASRLVNPPRAGRWRSAAMLFCLAVLVLLALQVVTHGPMLEFDQQVSHFFASRHRSTLTAVLMAVTTAHQTVYVLAATAVVAFWLAWRRDWNSARLLLVVPTGMLVNVGFKNLFQRARPAWDDPLVQLATYSFPSGHAVASTVFYGMLCALVYAHTRTRWKRALALAVAVGMVLLVCTSRVVLGAHFPGDVLAGVALGLFCVLAFLGWWRSPTA
ncbi:phosphatase PAP2 family protein [Ramlibacter sp. USB13]|uniref:Phosphatase PAP2 family protein n=1 Tax=Ramlibacter cellulosilyticus TaxID=2764187 RepID=A0A923MQF4_9BURK|nr:phosphatase PAP2 family protein [Ramlibacter cellulosilyticus]MBC5783917.1 phosphatase PAP2 family protein [Ramlibacter cellulosilyticus]